MYLEEGGGGGGGQGWCANAPQPVYSISWKFNLHVVYIFRTDWKFLIKFCPVLNKLEYGGANLVPIAKPLF